MQKWLLAIVLLSATLGMGQATYTLAGNGNWHTTGTWTHTGSPSCSTAYPCSPGDANYVSGGGDTVILPDQYTVTCEAG